MYLKLNAHKTRHSAFCKKHFKDGFNFLKIILVRGTKDNFHLLGVGKKNPSFQIYTRNI